MVAPFVHDGPGNPQPQLEPLFILPAPEPKSHRALRPLWRDLILKTWGDDPMRCPCCKGQMKNVGTAVYHEEIEFFRRLQGLWEPERSGTGTKWR